MKALIVSESPHETVLLETEVRQAGFETVTYRWVLKAIDNYDEINPDLVVINAIDFPRHWKILAQFIIGFCTETPLIVLLVPESFENQDLCRLHISCCINGFYPSELQKLSETITNHDMQASPASPEMVKLLFTHPRTGTICTGVAEQQTPKILRFHPDRILTDIIKGDLIDDAAIKTKNGIKSVRLEVTGTDTSLLLAFKDTELKKQ